MSSLFKLTCGFYESIAKKKPKTPQSLYKYQQKCIHCMKRHVQEGLILRYNSPSVHEHWSLKIITVCSYKYYTIEMNNYFFMQPHG